MSHHLICHYLSVAKKNRKKEEVIFTIIPTRQFAIWLLFRQLEVIIRLNTSEKLNLTNGMIQDKINHRRACVLSWLACQGRVLNQSLEWQTKYTKKLVLNVTNLVMQSKLWSKAFTKTNLSRVRFQVSFSIVSILKVISNTQKPS